MYRDLGQWSYRHWRIVIAAWVLVVLGVGAASGVVGSGYDSSFEIPASESRDGFDVLDEYFGGQGSGQQGSIVYQTERGVDDPAVEAAMNELFAFADGLTDDLQVVSPYDNVSPDGSRPQVASQGPGAGNIAFASLTLALDVDQVESAELGEQIIERAETVLDDAGLADDVQVELGGAALGPFEPPETELIGLAFAVIVLILSFGSVMAMGLPIGVAVAGVGTGLSLISLLSNGLAIPDFAVQIGAMIGLGVGIDYALFIVTRYRASLAAGHTQIDAVGIAIDTAGRSVIFAGLTVVLSLLGMLLIGLSFISGLGIGAATTVTVTMVASVTLLPALLGAVGDRIEVSRVRGVVAAGLVSVALFTLGIGQRQIALVAAITALVVLLVGTVIPLLNTTVPPRPERPIRETIAYRWSRVIQGHPWLSLLAGAGLLLVMAAPVLGLRLGFSDEGNFPEESTTRKAYDLIAEGFGPGFNGPLIVTAVLDSPEAMAQAAQLQEAIAATPGVASATPPIPNDPEAPEAVLLQVTPTTSPQDAATEDLVDRLREEVIPANGDGLEVSVTGAVPVNVDFTDYLAARILVFFGVVLALSFLLLMAVFRSVVVPVKAVVMNVLSIAASYGVVVAIFQWGWLGDLIGIAGAPIEVFIPMMLFAIVFGLSMDYEVFLLSRIKEEYERSGDPRSSVADGLASTARVITAAAAIMMVVFGSFMFEDNRIIKLFGLGLAMAVFLDATRVWTWGQSGPRGEGDHDESPFDRGDVGPRIRSNAAAWRRVLGRGDLVHQRPPVPAGAAPQWSALERGCHVRDVHQLLLERFERLLSEHDPAFTDWDEDAAAIERRYRDQDPARVGYDLARAAGRVADILDRVSGAQWDRPAHRSDGSSFTVESLARHGLNDVVHHLVAAEQGLKALLGDADDENAGGAEPDNEDEWS